MDSTTVMIRTIKKVSEEMNIPYHEVSKMIDIMFRSSKEKLLLDDMPKVLWRGFGTFLVRKGTLLREIERLEKQGIDDPARIERYKKIINRREHEEVRGHKKLQQSTKVRSGSGGKSSDSIQQKNNGQESTESFSKGS